ncbi:hypothetical protein DSECCO2_587670 [anaerobic digester metagenome]
MQGITFVDIVLDHVLSIGPGVVFCQIAQNRLGIIGDVKSREVAGEDILRDIRHGSGPADHHPRSAIGISGNEVIDNGIVMHDPTGI